MNRSLILCARGAEDPAGRADLSRLVNAVRREARGLDVVDCYLDGQEPGIAEVVASTSGPRALVPLVLVHDRAVSVDITRAAAVDASVTVTAPLGPDWVLAEIGVQRLIAAGARPSDTIVLAIDALVEDRAVTDVGKAARLLSAVWGGRVHVGSLGGPDTSLVEALDVARAYGRRVVVAPYLLTRGHALDVIGQAGADVVTAPILTHGAPDPRLVGLVLDRARSRSVPGAPQAAGPGDEPRLAHG
ncbi:sirohydrochlorin cobaltochelatase [Aeromicrobium marinum DSM 15272]|uniref:Sirohydrochlorin cobaltochelatase n=1 Tax=Aeromicrobium marinum DSM 15272 TaxID=585531 RepID=E2SEG8_9ACTN|nr:CbiX/SirB N-terminal domain-containing protein [Aeromicrobium marinum]EFQ82445.1 sirohydrochlorin cobaltochelatase [Aeromicrobium marinum DSM 15272]